MSYVGMPTPPWLVYSSGVANGNTPPTISEMPDEVDSESPLEGAGKQGLLLDVPDNLSDSENLTDYEYRRINGVLTPPLPLDAPKFDVPEEPSWDTEQGLGFDLIVANELEEEEKGLSFDEPEPPEAVVPIVGNGELVEGDEAAGGSGHIEEEPIPEEIVQLPVSPRNEIDNGAQGEVPVEPPADVELQQNISAPIVSTSELKRLLEETEVLKSKREEEEKNMKVLRAEILSKEADLLDSTCKVRGFDDEIAENARRILAYTEEIAGTAFAAVDRQDQAHVEGGSSGRRYAGQRRDCAVDAGANNADADFIA